MGPLMHGLLSVLNTIVLHDLLLWNLQTWNRGYGGTAYVEGDVSYIGVFDCVEGQCPNPCHVQGSAVFGQKKRNIDCTVKKITLWL